MRNRRAWWTGLGTGCLGGLVLVGTGYLLTLALGPGTGGPLKTSVVRWEEAQTVEANWGQMRFYFRGETALTTNALVAAAVVEPGKAVHRSHRHAEEEYLIVVSGEGTWQIEDRQLPAKQGDILYVEPWVYHGLVNTGTRPLIFAVVRYKSKGVPSPARPDDRPDEL